MLRTGQSPAPLWDGLPPLRPRALTRRRECCYRGPWRLPGPDSHRLAAVSLSLGYVVVPSSRWSSAPELLDAHSARIAALVAQELAAGRPGLRPGGGVDAGPRRPGRVKGGRRPPRSDASGMGCLDGFTAYLHQRWMEGCTDAAVRTKELKAQGYSGSDQTVRRYL